MRELKQPNHEEMQFLVSNKRRRFNIAEFALMTGLRCIGNLDKNRLKTGDGNFKKFYVKDYEKLSKADLEIVFLMNQFRSDEEVVNMVVLYLINNFLLFKVKMKLVDDVDIQICASGALMSTPLGQSGVQYDFAIYLKSIERESYEG